MKAGSMEGLIGASQNMKMMNVPMKVYHEAERKGDLGTMERAMGYAQEYSQKAEEYREKAQKELEKEQKEERAEFEKLQKEKLEEKRIEKKEQEKKEQEKTKEKAANSSGVEINISEEGKELAKENSYMEPVTAVYGSVTVNHSAQSETVSETRTPEISVTV